MQVLFARSVCIHIKQAIDFKPNNPILLLSYQLPIAPRIELLQ